MQTVTPTTQKPFVSISSAQKFWSMKMHPVPSIQADEVLVKNPCCQRQTQLIGKREGYFERDAATSPTFDLGWDFAGEVVAVGKAKISQWKLGDAVYTS